MTPSLIAPRHDRRAFAAGAVRQYSARQGAYRVVYEISEGQRAVVVLRIDHRSRVYRTR